MGQGGQLCSCEEGAGGVPSTELEAKHRLQCPMEKDATVAETGTAHPHGFISYGISRVTVRAWHKCPTQGRVEMQPRETSVTGLPKRI